MFKDLLVKCRAAGNIADQETSPEDHEILERFHEEQQKIRVEYGVSRTPEEEDLRIQMALERVSGAEQAVSKWTNRAIVYLNAGTDN